MKIPRNKRALTKINLMFIVALAVIGTGIILGYSIYYSNPVNINPDEARILADRIIDSVVSNGYLNEKVLDDSFNIFNETKLKQGLFYNDGYFYFELVILRDDKVIKTLFYGNEKLKLESQFQGKDFASGYYKELFVLDKKNPKNVYKIKILTASKQVINKNIN